MKQIDVLYVHDFLKSEWFAILATSITTIWDAIITSQ